MTESQQPLEKAKVNLETSQIAWAELQRFFAAGLTIFVDPRLDLVEVAHQFAQDNKAQVERWLTSGQVGPVTDQQAIAWLENHQQVWAVVVKPWVLVQTI